jgi:hypothetical protein
MIDLLPPFVLTLTAKAKKSRSVIPPLKSWYAPGFATAPRPSALMTYSAAWFGAGLVGGAVETLGYMALVKVQAIVRHVEFIATGEKIA